MELSPDLVGLGNSPSAARAALLLQPSVLFPGCSPTPFQITGGRRTLGIGCIGSGVPPICVMWELGWRLPPL